MNFERDAWYNNPRYRHYWKHHELMKQWYGDYKSAHQELHKLATLHSGWLQQYQQQMLHANWWDWYRHATSESLHHSDRCGEHRRPDDVRNRDDFRRRDDYERVSTETDAYRQAPESTTDCDGRVADGNGDDDDVELEMEITEEMKEFFAISARHRQERDAAKRRPTTTRDAAGEEGEGDYVLAEDVSSLHIRATVAPPAERPGVRRAAEMRELYGAGHAMIHGMETAMQLSYDRDCDIKQPKLWPSIPLNL
ncbi:PREDICTED: gem-associated protein 8-like [Priapulus caudatus]|uniref:Gem-associated protein 8-like n=1 Tax=Priapulus caudatus TaxID=37621 RepID=A0ABM1EM30_PRICU|nr:PREDICTED: gem-associated protein 8-like [Priapulus caudatus]